MSVADRSIDPRIMESAKEEPDVADVDVEAVSAEQ